MPQGRRDEVRIYKRGTKVGNIVEAVLEPADHKDDLLREVSSRDPDDVIAQVRKLVC
jgi:hypothetical protein